MSFYNLKKVVYLGHCILPVKDYMEALVDIKQATAADILLAAVANRQEVVVTDTLQVVVANTQQATTIDIDIKKPIAVNFEQVEEEGGDYYLSLRQL